MMKKLTITSKDISQKQWASLILELNLIKKAWRPYAKFRNTGTRDQENNILRDCKVYDTKERIDSGFKTLVHEGLLLFNGEVTKEKLV